MTLPQPVPSSAPIHKSPKTELPCKLFLNSLSIGRETQDWNYHRKVRCWISSNDQITLVQITGFSNWLQKGDYLEAFIPNLAVCDEIGKNCRVKVQFNSMYHHDSNFVINQKDHNLGTVLPINTYNPCKNYIIEILLIKNHLKLILSWIYLWINHKNIYYCR